MSYYLKYTQALSVYISFFEMIVTTLDNWLKWLLEHNSYRKQHHNVSLSLHKIKQ